MRRTGEPRRRRRRTSERRRRRKGRMTKRSRAGRRLCSFFLEISFMYLATTPREESSLGNIYISHFNLCIRFP
jgi:hypothetical protein